MTFIFKAYQASKDENGVGTVTGFFAMVIALLIGGFTVDYVNGTRIRAHLQTVTDSTALAGAMLLPEGKFEVGKSAIDLAEHYGPGLLRAGEVVLGNWSEDRFEASAFPAPNAVRATTRHSEESDNAPRGILMDLWVTST